MAGFETRHANCIAWGQKGALIFGASGAGKSGLSLDLMALGCVLVADDRTCLRVDNDRLIAFAPDATRGLIEARGIGILTAETATDIPVVLAIDLDHQTDDRLPPHRHVTVMGCALPLIYRPPGPNSASAIVQLLKTGRSDR